MQATVADRAIRLGVSSAPQSSRGSRSRPHALRSSRESPACWPTSRVLASAVPLGDIAEAVAASLFGPLIAAASVALYLLLASERATLAGQMAAVANVVAAGLVTAMVLVQLSVNDVEAGLSPEVNEAFEHVEFGLDLAWDVFLVAGTILFACAMIADRRFGRWFGVVGIIVAVALYALNFASFPTPPASDGLVDLGPLVGLWYAAVSIQALRLRRAMRQRHGIAAGAV